MHTFFWKLIPFNYDAFQLVSTSSSGSSWPFLKHVELTQALIVSKILARLCKNCDVSINKCLCQSDFLC